MKLPKRAWVWHGFTKPHDYTLVPYGRPHTTDAVLVKLVPIKLKPRRKA